VSGALEFRVLGPVEVVHDGVARRIGSPTQRTLLALLLMHPNGVVSTDRIIDVLWPDNPPEARRKLWFHVSKLRAILHPGGAEYAAAGMLATRPTGYTLRIDLDQLDAARFERLTRSGRSVPEDEPARAAEMLRQGLALWQGTPFADVIHEDAVSSEVARLDELRLSALEERLEADLALGRASELVPELEVLVAENPFREHLRAQLMLALYRAGRQEDALAVYRQTRRTLVEELGVEPNEGLKELHRRMLEHDPALAGRRPPPPRTAAPREERKVVTVFRAELVDFPATAEQLDPEDIRALLAPYYAHIRSEVARFGGTVEKFIGDAVIALFGASGVHEDDPERAVRAALAIRDWLSEQDQDRSQQVRIAVATGQAHVTLGALVTEGEPVAVGDVVNTAARLQLAAPVNGVLVSEQTFGATRHAIEYREARPVAAKGTKASITAWEAIRVLAQPGVDPSRHHSPFIGRERELAALQERLASAASQSSPQLVTILGVPGIGKSRLVSELRQVAAAANEPLTWRQGRSLPYGDGVSFWALGEMVKAEAGILESDPTQKVHRKLGKAVHRVVEDPAEARRIATYLGALTGLSGEEAISAERRGEMFAAWRRFLEALADERLLVLVFEDLHWADDALLDFVDELVDRVGGVPLLVVATARPELLERRPGWAGGKPNALTISLPPLSESDTRRLVAELLEGPVGPAEVHEALLARIGGNPLYAEQFCRMLVEHGQLEGLPESLHGIIAARLDALADVEKRLLQDASIVGKVFWLGTLEAIGDISRRDADELLQSLVRREFVQRARHSSVAGDTEYAFRHELLRDVAYDEIPRARKAERHRRVAEWIDSLGRAEDHAELLAHHYLAALDYGRAAGEDVTDVVDRARQALQSAGLRAMRLSANERSVEYISHAIDLLGRLPEGDERTRGEAELQLQLGVALFALRGLGAPEVERAYTRATELMMASAPAAEQFPVDFGLSIFHGHRGNFDRSTRLVERLTDLASEGDDSMRLQALHARWMNSLFSGRVDDAVAAADEGLGIYRREAHHATSFRFGNHDPGVCALALQALAFALRGESVRAVTQMQEAISLSEALGHAATLAQPLTQLPWALQINGDADAALLASERALAFEDEVTHPQFFGIAHAMRGWALSRVGREEEGVTELERAFADELRASHIWAAMIGALLAEVHLRHGRREVARDLLDQTGSLTESMPMYLYEPELMRVEAEWLRLDGREDDARRLLLRAISTARKHGSLALAFRSALVLARSPSAERDADLTLLGDLCERLPPENDTDYGREARALLGGGVATTLP
jgi:DNA-binding SARP family transcriptional activator/tetratricopeptide (TPR) repeat protein